MAEAGPPQVLLAATVPVDLPTVGTWVAPESARRGRVPLGRLATTRLTTSPEPAGLPGVGSRLATQSRVVGLVGLVLECGEVLALSLAVQQERPAIREGLVVAVGQACI